MQNQYKNYVREIFESCYELQSRRPRVDFFVEIGKAAEQRNCSLSSGACPCHATWELFRSSVLHHLPEHNNTLLRVSRTISCKLDIWIQSCIRFHLLFLKNLSHEQENIRFFPFSSMAYQPLVDQGLLIFEASRS